MRWSRMLVVLAFVGGACTKQDDAGKPGSEGRLSLAPGEARELVPARDTTLVVPRDARFYVVQDGKVLQSGVVKANAATKLAVTPAAAAAGKAVYVAVLGGETIHKPPPRLGGEPEPDAGIERPCPPGVPEEDCDELCMKCHGCCPPPVGDL